MRRWLLGITGALCALLLGACSAVAPLTTPATPRPAPTATPAPTAIPTSTSIPGRPAVGQEGELWASGLPRWHLAINEAAKDEYVSLTNAGDTVGLRQMIESGRAFPVDDGTRLLVLEQKDLAMVVRVLEGTQAGKTGWVSYNHVRFTR